MAKYVLFVLMTISTLIARAQEDEIVNAKKAGLVAYLSTVKALAEFKMLTLMADTQYVSNRDVVKAKVREFNSKYNLLKLTVDKLVNQLAADAYNSNRLQGYRAVNNLLKKGKPLPDKFGYYTEMIQKIDAGTTVLFFSKYGSIAGASLGDITGVAEQTIGIITAASEMREKKIQSVTALLKEQKLQALGSLKPKETKAD
jgi:hypothetical protein